MTTGSVGGPCARSREDTQRHAQNWWPCEEQFHNIRWQRKVGQPGQRVTPVSRSLQSGPRLPDLFAHFCYTIVIADQQLTVKFTELVTESAKVAILPQLQRMRNTFNLRKEPTFLVQHTT